MTVVHRIRSAFTFALAATSLAPALLAGIVHVVDASGGGAYTSIQAAITAADDGDTILVKTGTYPSFVVGNKTLAVVGDTGADVQVADGIRVRNLAAGKTVVLANLTATGGGTGANIHGLYLEDNAGSVRVEGSNFVGARLTCANPSNCTRSYGVLAMSCSDLALAGCTVVGGIVDRGSGAMSGPTSGDALSVEASAVAVYDSVFVGGDGGNAGWPHGVNAGAGATLRAASTLFASSSGFQGGNGGDSGLCGACFGCACEIAGYGGIGISIASGSAVLLDTDTLGGLGGTCPFQACCCEVEDGLPRYGTGFTDLPGTGRRLIVDHPIREDTTEAFRFFGAPGETVHLMVSTRVKWMYLPLWSGVLLVLPKSPHMMTTSLGTIPAGGTLNVQLPFSELGPGAESRVLHHQPVFIAPNGVKRLGTPASLVILDQAF